MGLLLVLWRNSSGTSAPSSERHKYQQPSGKHQKGTSSIYWQCCLEGRPRSWFSSPVLVLIWAGAKTQLLVHQEPSGDALVNAYTPIWHKCQILVILSGCDRRSQVWCSLIKMLLVLQQQQASGGETLVRPKSIGKAKVPDICDLVWL